MNHTFRSLLFAAVSIGVAACNPGYIDRTKPQYVKKSELLDGQWYYKNTVVGSPNSAVPALVGAGGKLEKIRWEIQEKLLVGYRTYEEAPGRDPRVDLAASRLGDVKFKDGTPYKG